MNTSNTSNNDFDDEHEGEKMFGKGARFLLIVMFLVSGARMSHADTWKKINTQITENKILKVISSAQQNDVFIQTARSVYKKEKQLDVFKEIFTTTNMTESVNDIFFDGQALYIGTTKGAYIKEYGSQAQQIFQSSDQLQSQVLSIIKVDEQVFLGTAGNLWSSVGNKNFKKISNLLDVQGIYDLNKSGEYMYISSINGGLLRYDFNENVVKTVFVDRSAKEPEDVQSDEGALNKQDYFIKAIDVKKNYVLIATSYGFYESEDSGEHWKRLSISSVTPSDVTAISLISPKSFLLSSTQGAYMAQNSRILPLYKGLSTTQILNVIYDSHFAYLATDQGVYKMTADELNDATVKNFKSLTPDELKEIVAYEPTIKEVQAMAIKYAQVDNKKVFDWQRQARQKAWLPQLDIGVDGGKDWSVSDTIYGSSSSGGTHYIAPDDKSSGEDIGWDIGLSWDLSDIIWSTDQTTIDSRAKLMVELREDILNQITRLYFERQRLKIELNANNEADTENILDTHIRMQELTALIDALTGGEFSEQVAERMNNGNKSESYF